MIKIAGWYNKKVEFIKHIHQFFFINSNDCILSDVAKPVERWDMNNNRHLISAPIASTSSVLIDFTYSPLYIASVTVTNQILKWKSVKPNEIYNLNSLCYDIKGGTKHIFTTTKEHEIFFIKCE